MTKLLEKIFAPKKLEFEIVRESLAALRDTPEQKAAQLAADIKDFEEWARA